MQKISELHGIKAPRFVSPHFKEFVVDFNDTGMTVENINTSLRKNKIFGGKDLSQEFSELGNCALYCVTEVHTKEDIDHLIQSLKRMN